MTSVPRPLKQPADLVGAGVVAPHDVEAVARVAERYAVSITPAVAALIDTGNACDPIARQFVPDPAELTALPDERADPIGDDAHEALPGLVHRYPDRVLLKIVSVCPVYCRFCFRRETVGPAGAGHDIVLSPDALAAALAYIRARPAIWEVILSGGDPMILSPRRLGEVMRALGEIEHVKIVRLHTRVPVVMPEHVTEALVAALRQSGKAVYVALHANHPREISPEARAACGRLVDRGVVMVGQTVLLAGVNDRADTLEALFRAMVETRVKPYYLHHLDRAPGTARFRTTLEAGQHLTAALRGRLSGLAQPTYVLDIPDGAGKVPVGPCYASPDGAGGYIVRDPAGRAHVYADGEVAP